MPEPTTEPTPQEKTIALLKEQGYSTTYSFPDSDSPVQGAECFVLVNATGPRSQIKEVNSRGHINGDPPSS